MPFNTKSKDKRKFLTFSIVMVVVTLCLGLYFVLTTINVLVTENHLFVNAFAQQQVLSNMTKNDNIFMNTNNNTLSSSNSSDKPSEEVLIDLYDKVD